MFREIDGAYVECGAAVSATLVFNYIAVKLRGCRYKDVKDVIVNGSFWAEEVDVLSYAFNLSAPFVLVSIRKFCIFYVHGSVSLSGPLIYPVVECLSWSWKVLAYGVLSQVVKDIVKGMLVKIAFC